MNKLKPKLKYILIFIGGLFMLAIFTFFILPILQPHKCPIKGQWSDGNRIGFSCMPGPGGMPAECGDREWIQKNCPNVEFAE